jgi:hypothetical protein
MKKYLVMSLSASFLMAGIASAQVSTNYISSCNSWNYSSSAGGYLCSGYPMSLQVVDPYSLNSKIQSLEARIQKLEAKLELVTEEKN